MMTNSASVPRGTRPHRYRLDGRHPVRAVPDPVPRREQVPVPAVPEAPRAPQDGDRRRPRRGGSDDFAQADARLADYEKSLATARNKANEEARKVRNEAATHEREVTDKARAAAAAALEEAQKTVRAETEAARATLLPQADVIAKSIASKLLGREVA